MLSHTFIHHENESTDITRHDLMEQYMTWRAITFTSPTYFTQDIISNRSTNGLTYLHTHIHDIILHEYIHTSHYMACIHCTHIFLHEFPCHYINLPIYIFSHIQYITLQSITSHHGTLLTYITYMISSHTDRQTGIHTYIKYHYIYIQFFTYIKSSKYILTYIHT